MPLWISHVCLYHRPVLSGSVIWLSMVWCVGVVWEIMQVKQSTACFNTTYLDFFLPHFCLSRITTQLCCLLVSQVSFIGTSLNSEVDYLHPQKITLGATPVSNKQETEATIHLAHQKWEAEGKNITWFDESRFLLRHSGGWIKIWCKQFKSLDPSCPISKLQAARGGLILQRMFSWHSLGP